MRENLAEQLTIDDMARTAMFSKFHFSRVFQRATGVSPGRFLSAIRLQEAKRLLVSTMFSVTEISHRVGYASVGTFSSRFRSSVGVSPTTYRQLGGFTTRICPDGRVRVTPKQSATIRGHVWPSAAGHAGAVFIGLFPDRLPQGQPIRCTVLDRPGPYALEDVPQGTWYVLAYAGEVPAAEEERLIPAQRNGDGDRVRALVGSVGPVTIRPETVIRPADVRLRPMNAFDPPVLLALLDGQSGS
ncbi:helix-turn-helix transcriptional regulator [Lentzea sp. PSKA42]|uniref:Helix-turn-helix transcriptional regulator n=2 Tax=Lentzea indica TaxID=2604800 RepID=A0ABX1FRI6_9PSEU|nr:helix-turn-helix transcriptional regulator [Lentzea indica]